MFETRGSVRGEVHVPRWVRSSLSARTRTNRIEQALLRVLGLFDQLGRRRWATILCLGVAVVAVRLTLLPLVPIPHPWIGDESSYLLGADTFASGRLTNPTPALWRSFEAIHVIMHPTYASKYPPGQAAFLAIGQVVFGNPYWGVVLGMALFCAAVCWMLQSMTSPGWALIGGILTFGIFGVNHYWMQSYWGGGVAAFGGCLITGSGFRMVRKLRPERYAWPLCAGIAVVFFTRPYEGCVFASAVVVLLVTQLWPQRRRLNLRRLLLPCVLVFSAVIAFQLYYDWRVTGSALTLPYTLHERQYSPAPTFWFQQPRKDVPRPSDPMIYGNHWRWELDGYYEVRQMPAWRCLIAMVHRELGLLPIFLGPLAYLLWMVPVFWSDLRIRYLTIVIAPVILAASLCVYAHLHYLAPAIPAIIALLVILCQQTRHLLLPSGMRIGTWIAALLMIAILGTAVAQARPDPERFGSGFTPAGHAETVPEQVLQEAKARDDLNRQLAHAGGRHIVIVRYSADHYPAPDWVHNGANIDAQSVIWARDRGPAENAALLSHYRDRHACLLQAYSRSYVFGPYQQ